MLGWTPVRVAVIAGCIILFGCTRARPVVTLQDAPVPQTLLPPDATILPNASPQELAWVLATETTVNAPSPESDRAIAAARKRSIVRPTAKDFRDAVVTFRYKPGVLWEVKTAMREATHLTFDMPGGWLRYGGIAYGDDKSWWEIEEARSGTPPHEKAHLLVTPKNTGLTGKLTVLTGAGSYYIILRSTKATGLTAVSWVHPPKSLNGRHPDAPVGTYHMGYRRAAIGRVPVWAPLAVWDTGDDGRTLILFPSARQTFDAPNLYLLSADGEYHLVNYVPRVPWGIVHARFERAELRLGHGDDAEVVRIDQGPNYRPIPCPGDPLCPPESWQAPPQEPMMADQPSRRRARRARR